jgi:hypothetical protein
VGPEAALVPVTRSLFRGVDFSFNFFSARIISLRGIFGTTLCAITNAEMPKNY